MKRLLLSVALCGSMLSAAHSEEDAAPPDPVEKEMGEMLKLLERSQHDWLAFRDSEEALRISFNAGRRGTMVGMLAVEARAMFVRSRVQTLRRYEEKSFHEL